MRRACKSRPASSERTNLPLIEPTDYGEKANMSYFSRLSDIISCNVNDLIAGAADPLAALRQIIAEMEQGLAGARRSVAAAAHSEQRLRAEADEYSAQAKRWGVTAREELAAGREDQARLALLRKREQEDLVAGLEQQHAAAVLTRDHLTTTLHAIEARVAEANRRRRLIESGASATDVGNTIGSPLSGPAEDEAPLRSRASEIDADLEALRRELQQNG